MLSGDGLSPRVWQSMLDAAQEGAAANGVDLDVAKVGLCHAISDQTNEIQGFVRAGLSLLLITVAIPRELKPDDIDWLESRPFDPWKGAGSFSRVSL